MVFGAPTTMSNPEKSAAASSGEHPGTTIDYPGSTADMPEPPRDSMSDYEGRDLLRGRRALITGGDSGIGRAVAVAFAKEGADVAIAYLSEAEDDDAAYTVELIEQAGRSAVAVRGDLADPQRCRAAVERTVAAFGGLDVLVNNVAFQAPVADLSELTAEQWDRTFRVNVDSFFHTTVAALPYLTPGGTVINTGSINGLRGNKQLIDYAATKGAVHVLTYSLAQALMDREIRVNCVAPGPVWTPLIPATLPADQVRDFGEQAPMGRAAEPDEIAPSYVFLASDQYSSYYTGQVLAPVGGETLPG
ncbi:SDR family oxidoreductase [Gordonia alkaliphila]|uniref:SDR family oxidoreductase n=2 Tax=Gordonia alkaliphila TaxID=1053547 RepID=A0ABP8Z7P0_9ACTN